MAASKLDLPEDLLHSANLHDDIAWTAGKDVLAGGNTEDKALLELVDESKDQMTPENSIPLSPQWLYAKPTESKVVLSTAAGETRPGNLSTLGTLPDSAQKDVWRLDGSQEKKERRRNVPDVESNRSWREEERETSLLGRRERKKDDRESEYRKNERRPDNVSARETIDSRSLPSSDRWAEVPNRNVGNESRRDSKWSTRWGPDDKDKDSRTEKKMDADKEDPHVEKQSFVANLRPLSDTDSRDKWRPRHRQEVQNVGSSTYRAAPGFGLERGRVEGTTVGFAPGRGRSNSNTGLQFIRSSATTIGSEPVRGKSALSLDTFRYPRAKLLDIYRKQKVTLFDDAPDGLEEVPPITESSFIMPLAFVTPETEEEGLLKNIWKGKITNSEVSYSTGRERMTKINDHEIDAGDNIQNEREPGQELDFGETKDKTTVVNEVISESSTANTVDLGVGINIKVSSGNYATSGFTTDDLKVLNDDKNSDIRKNVRIGETSRISFDASAKLPDNANDLFDASVVEQITNTRDHEKILQTISFGQGAHPEELNLFYQDPQGVVQGPFLGVDIISWFEDGFFGLDLPVCLSDAPEGTPFQPLGEVMPYLKLKVQSFPDINPNKGSEQLATLSSMTEANIPSSDVTGSLVTNNQLAITSFNGLEHLSKHNVIENETSVIPQQDMVPISNSERQLISPTEEQAFHDFSRQDSEEVLYIGRTLSNMEKQLGDVGDELINLPKSSSDQHYAVIGTGDNSLSNQNMQRDSDLNPLGLLWSELNGNHPKHPLSSAIPSIADKAIMNSSAVTNAMSDLPAATDVWPSNFRSNDSNVTHDVLDHSQLSQFEFEPNQLSLDEHLFLQQMQKQQQQQHQKQQLAHQNIDFSGQFSNQMHGSLSHERSLNQPDLEHLLQLQLEQKLHFEQMQQQIQLHQQQQNLRQQHMQLIRQQQQQQQQQQLLLEQQQQQQQQLILEQLLHQQLQDRGFGGLNVDPRRVNNMVDEVLLRQQLLHESRQPHHLAQLHDPAIEQIIQAKYGQNLNRENQYDLLDALSHSKQRQMLPLEQQFLLSLQQEQLQARQFSTSRQHPGIDEERHIGGLWSVDESGQFIRTAASPHQGHPTRANQLNLMQSPHRPSSFEQPSQLERNFLLHERMQRAQYEQGLRDLEMLNSIHAGVPGSNLDRANTLTHLHALGGHEHHNQLHSAGQIAQFPTSARLHQHPTTEEFTGIRMDEMEQNLLDRNEQISSSLGESYLNRLQVDAEKKLRSLQLNGSLEDTNLWASQLANDGSSEHSLQEILHQKMLQSNQPIGLLGGPPTTSIENRDSWLHSRPGDGYSFNLHSDRLGLNNKVEDTSLFPKSGQPMNLNLEGHTNSFEGNGRLPYRSSATLLEQKQILSDLDQIERQQFVNSMNGEASMEGYARELRMGNMQDLKGITSGRSNMEMLELGTRQVPVKENEELKFNPPSRHTSTGSISNGGGVNFYLGMGENPPNEETINNRVSGAPVKGHIVSSQPGVSDMISSQHPKGKTPTNSAAYENKISNQVVQSVEVPASNKKDMRFRRTPSISDADYAEPTFSDMLKSTKKSMPEVDGHGDAPETGAGGKSIKKKGKKGRQIDPSLLGFKVHSNRILMGEIQRLDD